MLWNYQIIVSVEDTSEQCRRKVTSFTVTLAGLQATRKVVHLVSFCLQTYVIFLSSTELKESQYQFISWHGNSGVRLAKRFQGLGEFLWILTKEYYGSHYPLLILTVAQIFHQNRIGENFSQSYPYTATLKWIYNSRWLSLSRWPALSKVPI